MAKGRCWRRWPAPAGGDRTVLAGPGPPVQQTRLAQDTGQRAGLSGCGAMKIERGSAGL